MEMFIFLRCNYFVFASLSPCNMRLVVYPFHSLPSASTSASLCTHVKAMASKEEYEDEDGGYGTGINKDGSPKGMKTSRRGVLALVSLLEKHAGLTEVDLFNMDIGDYGAVALGKVSNRHQRVSYSRLSCVLNSETCSFTPVSRGIISLIRDSFYVQI